MKLTLEINMDNAAFEDAPGQEAARILHKIACKIQDWPGANEFNLRLSDLNGNKVGHVTVSND